MTRSTCRPRYCAHVRPVAVPASTHRAEPRPNPARRRVRRRLLAAGAAIALVGAACSDSLENPTAGTSTAAETTEADVPDTTDVPDENPTAPATTDAGSSASTTPDAAPETTDGSGGEVGVPEPPSDVEWTVLDGRVDEARVAVPLDHDDPDGEQIEIYMVRHRAEPESRIGVLFVNPGGPGFGGSFLAQQAEFIYGPDLLASFDIIGFDPRGTGLSEPNVDCVDDYDPFFGIETGPDDAAEDEALQRQAAFFAQSCIDRSGELLAHVDTIAAATDIDLIRQALGEEQVSWFGWSYGTALGAAWVTLFPETVRAAVLDGAVDPTVDRIDGLVQQSAGFDASLTTFLENCAAAPSCAFAPDGDAEGAFLELLTQLETTRIPTEDGRPDVTQGVFELAVAQALYSDSLWPQLEQALADAIDGDGAGILALYDAYYGRLPGGGYADDLEAYFAITCADDPSAGGDAGIDEAVERRADFLRSSPRIGTSAAYEVLICASFPGGTFGEVEDFEITGAGAGPVVVVGNTGDPATPFEGSRRMAETLEGGVFVEVEAEQHTAYGLNACINGAIDEYLVDLVVPEGVRC